jgi:8-amino-7-oxononanoate synthase
VEQPGKIFGLSAEAKARLIERLSSRLESSAAPQRPDAASLAGSAELNIVAVAADYLGIEDPFFRMHDGLAAAETVIDGRRYTNFGSYDYLALNGDERIGEAAKAAIDR